MHPVKHLPLRNAKSELLEIGKTSVMANGFSIPHQRKVAMSANVSLPRTRIFTKPTEVFGARTKFVLTSWIIA